MTVWNKYGLISPRFLGTRGASPRYSTLPRSTRFRLALEEEGGLPALYGLYLAGRADLLPYPHLRQLRQIRLQRDFSAREVIDRELGGRVTDVLPLKMAPCSEIYQGVHKGQCVSVEVCTGQTRAFEERAWKKFVREVRLLEDGIEARITRRHALEQFQEWLLLAGDVERKRMILANLQEMPGGCVTTFPRLIPDLQSAGCLVYEGTKLEALSSRVQAGDPASAKSLQLLVESLLEQSLLLSLIDAEGKTENFTALPDGGLGFRSVPVLAPVPVEWHYELLQYMASTVAGHSPRALHMLSRISSEHEPYAGEQQLLRELSGLQPELKINIVTPESVTSLENYWRALANTQMRPPLFLHLFHRQWTLAGQYNGEVAPGVDLIEESLWPVLGRVLRYRATEMLTPDKGREWAANSGLMLLTAARQATMLLEQVRDNDMAMIVDRQESEPLDAAANGRTLSLIRAAMTLGVFLAAAYLAFNTGGGAVQLAAGATTAISAVVLTIFVARIE